MYTPIRTDVPTRFFTRVRITCTGHGASPHAYGDITPVSTARFVGSDAFTVSGPPIAEDAAVIDAGLDFKLTKDATLDISYNAQFASGARQNGLNAKLSVNF